MFQVWNNTIQSSRNLPITLVSHLLTRTLTFIYGTNILTNKKSDFSGLYSKPVKGHCDCVKSSRQQCLLSFINPYLISTFVSSLVYLFSDYGRHSAKHSNWNVHLDEFSQSKPTLEPAPRARITSILPCLPTHHPASPGHSDSWSPISINLISIVGGTMKRLILPF